MNDRYLYRAKRTDNRELVDGNIITYNDRCFIVQKFGISCIEEHKNLMGDNMISLYAFEVDPSTICQCTGLKDKNGKLIFENDLVKIKGTVFQCFWNESNFEFGFKNNSEDFGIAYVSSDDIRIVGNVFDNQELLEVGE